VSRVSYQVPRDAAASAPASFRTLDSGAIGTRCKDAKVRFTVDLSKRQARWLRSATASGGTPIRPELIVRAAIDLAMELDIDWTGIRRPADLRAAIREAVLVRRPGS
jgi:hypothetical protein